MQPWLDIPELGSAVVVVCEGDSGNLGASRAARDLAEEVWDHRRDYLPELVEIAEAVRAAHAQADGLTVISDSADATTSGSTGDSTACAARVAEVRLAAARSGDAGRRRRSSPKRSGAASGRRGRRRSARRAIRAIFEPIDARR